jgi:hypothetical protein
MSNVAVQHKRSSLEYNHNVDLMDSEGDKNESVLYLLNIEVGQTILFQLPFLPEWEKYPHMKKFDKNTFHSFYDFYLLW